MQLTPTVLLPPPTYSEGTKTIDHIWISADLKPLLTGYGYLPFNEGFMSDHHGTFIHLRLKHANNPPPTINEKRKLVSKNPASVVRYLDNVNRMTLNYLLFKKIDYLKGKQQFQEEDVEALQFVDKILTGIQLASEADLYKNKTSHSFSDTIHQLKCIRRYWRIILRLRRHTTTHQHLLSLNPKHQEENINLPRKIILRHIQDVTEEIMSAVNQQDHLRNEHLQRLSCLEPQKY